MLILAAERVATLLEGYGLTGTVIATCKGKALELLEFRHPVLPAQFAGVPGRLRHA
jgi:isoleucyl-tRNA synthetase